MCRSLLILCYLLSVLTGPQPCCCAATSPTPQPAATKTAPTPPVKGCPRCAAAPKPDPAPKPDQPAPAKKPNCPCPKAAVNDPAVPPTDDSRQQVADLGAATGFAPVVATPVHSFNTTIVGPPPDPSAHLLQLCRLRC